HVIPSGSVMLDPSLDPGPAGGPLLASLAAFASEGAPALARTIADLAIALATFGRKKPLPDASGRRRTAPFLCAACFVALDAGLHFVDAGAPWIATPLAGDLIRAALA